MNNNTRRRLERRQRQRRERQQHAPNIPHRPDPIGADPIMEPLQPGERCAVCTRNPATTKAEIATASSGELIYPICKPCAQAMPVLLARFGFAGLQKRIAVNMRAA